MRRAEEAYSFCSSEKLQRKSGARGGNKWLRVSVRRQLRGNK